MQFTFDKPTYGKVSKDKTFSSPPMYILVAIRVGIDKPSAMKIIKFFATFLFMCFSKVSFKICWPDACQNSRDFSSNGPCGSV